MDEGTLHVKIQEHLSSIAKALEAMHRDVAEIGDQRRMQARARRAARAKPPNFVVGDFVLVASVVAAPNKLSIKWQGPKHVTKAVSDWIFEVEDLVEPHVTSTHHVSRLRFYAESAREVSEDLLQHALHAQGGHCVEDFRGIRLNTTANQWQVEVKRLGLDELENTWESYASLQTDVPVMLARYCEAHKEEPQFAEMLQAVSRQPRARRTAVSSIRVSTLHRAVGPTPPARHAAADAANSAEGKCSGGCQMMPPDDEHQGAGFM
ncbi:hypothetical protein ON010_g7742 [Phytophthora cinnamomi]|nr:hypothetical protein ON010_g7742 [Phytophthora cinnamomi]